MSGKDTGRMGEALAAEILEKQGYDIISRNVHSMYGELDLIASNEDCLCFVEVKVRKKGAMVSPEESITPAKKRRIIMTALMYLQNHPTTLQPRFDLFSILTDGEKVISYEHMKGAFDADEY